MTKLPNGIGSNRFIIFIVCLCVIIFQPFSHLIRCYVVCTNCSRAALHSTVFNAIDDVDDDDDVDTLTLDLVAIFVVSRSFSLFCSWKNGISTKTVHPKIPKIQPEIGICGGKRRQHKIISNSAFIEQCNSFTLWSIAWIFACTFSRTKVSGHIDRPSNPCYERC